jgi:hypothetical protein
MNLLGPKPHSESRWLYEGDAGMGFEIGLGADYLRLR